MSVADKMGFSPKREVSFKADHIEIHVTPHPMVGDLPTLVVKMTKDQYERYKKWRNDELMIQDAFPEFSSSTLEVLQTGLGDDDFHNMCMEQDEEDD